MKSIKKFSAMTAKDQPITESAKVTKEAVDELIKKIGFDSIEELKKEKDLLSKLEAMSKTFAKSNDISEDEIEEDRAEDIEDEMNAKGKAKSLEDEKEGDELEDKGDKKVDSEDDKEKADHYKGAVKSDDKQIDALKKDAEYDKEEEEDAEKNESVIMDFASFVNEAYDKVVLGGNKGDKSKTKEDEEDYEDEDKTDEKYDDVVLGGNKGDKSKTHDGEDFEDEDEKDESANEKYDDVVLGGNKGDKSKTHDGEDFEDEDEKDESVEEAVGEVITKVEGDEIADEVAGDDGIAIPAIKGDGPETAAGIAGDIMDMGKPKSIEGKGKELITPDQKITDVVKGEGDDLADGTEIVKEEEEVLPDDSIAEKFRKLANNKLGKVNEAEIKSADEFKEYAMKMLKDAFGDDFDETKATETADGLIDKYGEDYGAMVGALQSTMGS